MTELPKVIQNAVVYDAENEPFPPETAVALARSYVAPGGGPTVSFVDTRIYTTTYFQPCFDCTFCGDSCCQYGVSIDFANVDRVKAIAAELAPYASGPSNDWFDYDDLVEDEPDYPGHAAIRTRLLDGTCVFRRPDARGCGIHAYALDRGIDYHEHKPLYCCLFPLTVDSGYLMPALEVLEKSLVCVDHGTSVYRGSRDEVRYYFGEQLVAELDAFERQTMTTHAATLPSRP
jgi:Fe-S-cluster containining protein